MIRSQSVRRAVARAVRPLLESLESRRLLHGIPAFDLHVNFQPASSVVPAGYLADTGQVFADRGNGFSYGWNLSNASATRERNLNPDQLYDTLTHTQAYGVRTWEAAVPNGDYTVHLVAGDPQYFNSIYKFNAENILALSGTPTTGARFVEGTQTVTVADGRLTISNAPGADNNRLMYIDITSADDDGLPHVSVAATDAAASEAGPDNAIFTITREGDTTADLIVSYAMSGLAGNGSDYAQLLGSVTIPAGSPSAVVTIAPVDDQVVEGSEDAILTINPDAAYEIVTPSASATIADNDTGATAFAARINFEPAGSPVPTDYLADTGAVFGDRGNGFSYGWSSLNTSWTRDRNNAASPDDRYDTLTHFRATSWELAVPNGSYSVHIVSGDPIYTDSVYKIDAEGVHVVDGTPTSAAHWIEGTALVNVSDGRLTLTNAAGSSNNRICFIEVISSAAPLSTVTVTAPTANASEAGTVSRAFTFSRTGATTSPLTLLFTVGGSASNGGDYNLLPTSITIPAGSASATLNVTPIDDTAQESLETVLLTLKTDNSYSIGAGSAATIKIADNDVAPGNNITWTNKANALASRSEALHAVVDGKLYVFGGFGGNGPINRADVYDPVANSWTNLPNMPTRLSHAGVAVDGHDIYLAGGYIGNSANGTGWSQKFGVTDVWKYNVDTKQYTAFVPLPKEVAGGGLVLLGRELHWVAGNNNQRHDIGDHYILNLDNTAAGWQTSTPLPFGRSHLGVVTMGGKIYVVAGQFGNDDGLTTQKYVHMWDPANPGVWTRLADLPTAISHIASSTIVFGNRIITLGGETAHNRSTNLVYSYDPVTDAWSSMSNLPANRFSGVAAEIGEEIYYTTGSTTNTTWKGVVS